MVTATNEGGDGHPAAAADATDAVVASPPDDTIPPAITGDADVGGTLTAGTGTWTGTAPVTFTYQWQRCDADGTNCVDIAGATDDTYKLGDGRPRPHRRGRRDRHQRRRQRHLDERAERRGARAAGQHGRADHLR